MTTTQDTPERPPHLERRLEQRRREGEAKRLAEAAEPPPAS